MVSEGEVHVLLQAQAHVQLQALRGHHQRRLLRYVHVRLLLVRQLLLLGKHIISTCIVPGLRFEPRYKRSYNQPPCLYGSGETPGGGEENEKERVMNE